MSLTGYVEVLVHWAPPEERSRLVLMPSVGTYLGSVISYLLSGILANHYGWESVFYVTGEQNYAIYRMGQKSLNVSIKESKYMLEKVLYIIENVIKDVMCPTTSSLPMRNCLIMLRNMRHRMASGIALISLVIALLQFRNHCWTNGIHIIFQVSYRIHLLGWGLGSRVAREAMKLIYYRKMFAKTPSSWRRYMLPCCLSGNTKVVSKITLHIFKFPNEIYDNGETRRECYVGIYGNTVNIWWEIVAYNEKTRLLTIE